MIRKIVLPILAVCALGFALFYVQKNRTDSGTSVRREPPPRPAGTVVAGSGIIEPQTESIAVGTPTPGIVEWVMGHDRLNSPVEAGEVLFRIDSRLSKAGLAVREAGLASAQAQLERLKQMPRPEEVEPIASKLLQAKVSLEDQQDQFKRTKRLYESRALSEDEYRRRWFALQLTQEQLHTADTELALIKKGSWSADIAVAEAAVKQAEAQVQQARIELELLNISAPITGELLQINIRPGEFVSSQPGQSLVALGNIRDLHVRVDIDEHDVPRFRPDLPATAYVSGRPSFPYELDFVRLEPYMVPKRTLTGDVPSQGGDAVRSNCPSDAAHARGSCAAIDCPPVSSMIRLSGLPGTSVWPERTLTRICLALSAAARAAGPSMRTSASVTMITCVGVVIAGPPASCRSAGWRFVGPEGRTSLGISRARSIDLIGTPVAHQRTSREKSPIVSGSLGGRRGI